MAGQSPKFRTQREISAPGTCHETGWCGEMARVQDAGTGVVTNGRDPQYGSGHDGVYPHFPRFYP
jgi:hypothetical protein